MHVIVILNEEAGSLQGENPTLAPDEVRAAFAGEGVGADVRVVAAGHLVATLTTILDQTPDAIFVGGGDGTISTAASVLAGGDVPLGVLPLGTYNHFARDLGVPSAWRAAVSALVHGERRRVDLGQVNDRTFINNCSIGWYAEAVRKREALRRKHGVRKWWAMLRATTAVFLRLRRMRVQLGLGERALPLRTPFIVVANNRYSGRVLDSSLRPQLNEGRLWIYTTRVRGRLAILRMMLQSLLHELDAPDDLDIHAVTAAELTAELIRPAIALDGEVVDLPWPLRFRSLPGALPVLIPRPERLRP
jgi:diacylglycerol kinase family enzyme